MTNLAVIILTKNEEKHIKRAIENVKRLTPSIFVIDSGSSDATTSIANACGATVLHHIWTNYAQQFHWALNNIPTNASYILRLDADEYLSSELIEELKNTLKTLPADVTGIVLKRKYIFQNKRLCFGGRASLPLLRIIHRSAGTIETRWMDEHLTVTYGKTISCKNPFFDHNLNDLSYFTEKHNAYATREAIDRLLSSPSKPITSLQYSAQITRFLKEKIYNPMPYPISAVAYFMLRYILQLGILDGMAGLNYHILQGFWYRFLVGAKLAELRTQLAHCQNNQQKADVLYNLTGHKVSSTDFS